MNRLEPLQNSPPPIFIIYPVPVFSSCLHLHTGPQPLPLATFGLLLTTLFSYTWENHLFQLMWRLPCSKLSCLSRSFTDFLTMPYFLLLKKLLLASAISQLWSFHPSENQLTEITLNCPKHTNSFLCIIIKNLTTERAYFTNNSQGPYFCFSINVGLVPRVLFCSAFSS